MEVSLTPDQEALIRHAVESGRLHAPEEAVREALTLWEEEERSRLEVLAAVDAAEASLACDQGILITRESMRRLADDIKRRGRRRLAADQSSPR